jgi:hypothetical protein
MTDVLVCAVCGKPVDPKQPHTAVKNRITKEVRYEHIACPSIGK